MLTKLRPDHEAAKSVLSRDAMREVVIRPIFRILALFVVLVGALAGCRCRPEQPAAEPTPKASLRLVFVSSAAGALEPCGCVKDMLGGVDHAAAFLHKHKDVPTLVLGAGPMLFAEPSLKSDRLAQDLWKARAMSGALRDMGLRAWAPGANDFAAGINELSALSDKGSLLLAANLQGRPAGARASSTFRVGDVQVGVVGISVPRVDGRLPEGVVLTDAAAALRDAAGELRRANVPLRVALLAMPRGEALRLAELVPEFQLILLGKPVDQGASNDAVTPPVQIGRTLVVEAPNHLQALYSVELFFENGQLELPAAAGGDVDVLDRRIGELSQRIAAAEKSANVAAADLAARRRDLEGLRRQREQAKQQQAPQKQRHRVQLVEVRESLGSDDAVAARLVEYYRQVNEHNRVAFKDRVPPPVAKGESGYIGAEACSTCHREEHAFWSQTRHASAYATLSRQHKQFNLDCVSCHVTGYGEPGGSTVVQVGGFENVQCEVCHGPGSRHATSPTDPALIVAHPAPESCVSKCHHTPHVNADWDVMQALPHVLGPGHGR